MTDELGETAVPQTDHQTDVSPGLIDTSKAREWIANCHGDGVEADDVVIKRIDAPSTVYYNIR